MRGCFLIMFLNGAPLGASFRFILEFLDMGLDSKHASLDLRNLQTGTRLNYLTYIYSYMARNISVL